jgi:hypothetical protein
MADTETLVADVSDWDETPDSPEAAPAPVAAPPVQATPESAVPEQQGGPDDDDGDVPAERTRDERGRWRRRKDMASPEDVPRIKELSRQLRETREQFEQFKKQATQPKVDAPVYRVPAVPSEPFKEPEPTLEQFADKDDPYGAWQRELARYDRRKEQHEEMLAHQQAHQQRLQQDASRAWQQVSSTHQQRLLAAQAANPTIAQTLQSVRVQPPPVLDWAIMLDNQSVDVALFLATHPAVLDEFVLMTAPQPVTQQTVETTQRLLRQRMTTVSSGAVAPSPAFSAAPRPPTPLRTAPMKSGETMPGDDDSLEAHERFYKRPTGRRR